MNASGDRAQPPVADAIRWVRKRQRRRKLRRVARHEVVVHRQCRALNIDAAGVNEATVGRGRACMVVADHGIVDHEGARRLDHDPASICVAGERREPGCGADQVLADRSVGERQPAPVVDPATVRFGVGAIDVARARRSDGESSGRGGPVPGDDAVRDGHGGPSAGLRLRDLDAAPLRDDTGIARNPDPGVRLGARASHSAGDRHAGDRDSRLSRRLVHADSQDAVPTPDDGRRRPCPDDRDAHVDGDFARERARVRSGSCYPRGLQRSPPSALSNSLNSPPTHKAFLAGAGLQATPPATRTPQATARRRLVRIRSTPSSQSASCVFCAPIRPAPLDHALDGDGRVLADGSYLRFIAVEEAEDGLICRHED